jgi:hypothetical protein
MYLHMYIRLSKIQITDRQNVHIQIGETKIYTLINLTSPNLIYVGNQPSGGCRHAGSDKVDIFSHFVEIVTIGNLDVNIRKEILFF